MNLLAELMNGSYIMSARSCSAYTGSSLVYTRKLHGLSRDALEACCISKDKWCQFSVVSAWCKLQKQAQSDCDHNDKAV